jgi:hypothetical protein
MEKFRPELRKYYYNSGMYMNYLEQLGSIRPEQPNCGLPLNLSVRQDRKAVFLSEVV